MKALITGASSGIGKDFARILSKQGYDLVLVARDLEKLQEVKKELGGNIKIISMDLSNPDNCKQLHEENPNIDLLINNAGFGDCGNFAITNLDKEISMINTNITAYHILTKLYLIDMKKEYIDSHNDNKDHILLGFINNLEYTKYKDEANKKLIEIYGFKGTINLADTYGNKIKNTDVPNEYRLILNVTGGRENETGDFNWYEYDKNYNPISLGTHCKLADGESCQTKNKTKNKRNGCYGYAVYYENDELIYKVADIKW